MLKKLRIQNFRSYEEAILDFSPFINVIIGISGKGKTNIFRAIQWLSKNRPLGNRVHSKFANQNDSTVVEIETTEGDICVLSKFGKDSGYYLNSEVFPTPDKDTPDLIQQTLNLTDLNIQFQHDKNFLVFESPGNIAKTINEITHLDQLDEWVSNLTTKINTTEKNIKFLDKETVSITSQLSSYTNLSTLENLIIKAEEAEIHALISTQNELQLTNLISDARTIEQKLKQVEAILKHKKTISQIEQLYTTIREKEDLIIILQKYIETDRRIKINKQFIKKVYPIINQLDQYIENIKKIDKDIIKLSKDINILKDMENNIIEVKNELVKITDEFKKYLEEIKICPVCQSELNENNINSIIMGGC